MVRRKNVRNRRKKIEKKLWENRNAELDAIDKDFFPLVSRNRTCNKCGKCCSIYKLLLTQDDLDREPKLIASSCAIDQSVQERFNIDKKYRRIINTIESSQQCHFYAEGIGCSIYESRPEMCRNYIPTLNNCIKARMAYAGFNFEQWSGHCITEYCKTDLHRNTGLCMPIDYKAIYIYSKIMPYLISEERIEYYHEITKELPLLPADFRIEQLIDLDAEIPYWIREYLQLDDKSKTIKDIFSPHALPANIR